MESNPFAPLNRLRIAVPPTGIAWLPELPSALNVHPPPITVPDTPKGPLEQTKGPEPMNFWANMGSEFTPPVKAGSTVQDGVPRLRQGA